MPHHICGDSQKLTDTFHAQARNAPDHVSAAVFLGELGVAMMPRIQGTGNTGNL